MEKELFYNTVLELFEQLSQTLGKELEIDKNKFLKLEEICDMLDEFSEEENIMADDLYTDLSLEKKQLKFRIYASDFVFKDSGAKLFFSLIKEFDSFHFSADKESTLLTLTMDNVWC